MMNFLQIRVLLALCCAAALALPARADDSAFDAALQLYERNHWPAAFTALSRLADAGDAEAARVATLMWRHGPALYGSTFTPSAEQVGRWWAARATGARDHGERESTATFPARRMTSSGDR